MDKNNDIKTSNVSKWDAAPKNMGTLFTYIELVIGMACSLPQEIRDNLYDLMDKTLDEYNELEAKHQEACGMISQYEEENRILREQRKELAGDNDILRHERDRHIDLLDKLRLALEEKGIYSEWSEAALEWRLYGKNKLFDELREHYEEELRIREKEKDEKDKLIDELNSKIRMLKLRMSMMHSCYGLNSKYGELIKKIETLEKENKFLKDTIEKDESFGKYVGKLVADSIREGCDKGVYELHPYTRIDIHVEETNNMPTTFDRHAIPRIAIMFNNTQTEMERDTAQHECEELNEKVDRLWCVNDELNRKIKGLEKENTDLKRTLSMCERDANMARELCHTVAFNAERARNNKEEN